MKLNETQRAELRQLFEANGLTKDHIFAHRHFVIVTRAGIEVIQAKQGLDVTFEVVKCEPDFVVMKALGRKVGDEARRVETFGVPRRRIARPNTSSRWPRNARCPVPS